MSAPSGPLPGPLLAVLAVFTAQQSLAPMQAPLAREVGLSELSLGLILTAGAVMFAGTAVLWGRAVDRIGHRRVLLAGMLLSLGGVAGFALVSQLALAGVLEPGVTLALMIATRSLLFGGGVGAVPVAAIALVAATTISEAARTRGIGQIGAVQGVAIALGPALGGALGFAGLLGPLWAAPAVVAIAVVVVMVVLPTTPRVAPDASALDAAPRRALRPWDPRLWPVLLAGFGLYLALGMTLIVLGFLIQDRLALDAAATVSATGVASFAAGLVLIGAQGVLVPRLGWSASRLLRVGSPVAALGLLVLLVANSLGLIVVAMGMIAAGLGLAIPGYTTAPTLLVGPDEQGGIAGLVQTATGVTFIVAPVTGTALYGVSTELPVLAAVGSCALAALFVWLHPALRPSTISSPTTVEGAG
jgi:MFS family permease